MSTSAHYRVRETLPEPYLCHLIYTYYYIYIHFNIPLHWNLFVPYLVMVMRDN